jgi:hypothetical protein
MKLRLTSLALLVALLGAFVLAPMSARAQPQTTAAVPIPITGTFPDLLGGTGTFTGIFTLQQFVSHGGVLSAVGTLTGTLTDSAGTVLGTVTDLPLTIPLTQATGSCPILHLELGPLDLTLLGLMVHLNQVVLDITAQSGPGNLLGNLLRAVAHLLDSNASGNVLANLLNRILGLLG